MRLHCIADYIYVPESEIELVELLKNLKKDGISFRLLSGGSNVILPPHIHKSIILLCDVNKEIEFHDEFVKVGASVRIQTLIRSLQKHSLGGIENMFSIPCMLGGAIYMNAGRGKLHKKSISNHIVSVKAVNLSKMEIEELTSEKCAFSYRKSVFQEGNYVILSAKMKFDKMPESDIENAIRERIKTSKEKLDANKPSCGSIFSTSSYQIMKMIKGFRVGGACWSSKTNNWISNDQQGSYNNIKSLINVAKILHKITFRPCRLEVEVWE